MKLAFCGYDFFAEVLEGICASDHQLLAVFSFEVGAFDSYQRVSQIAYARRVPFSLEPISGESLRQLRRFGVELLVVAGYKYRIPIEECRTEEIPKVINFHPSALPVGRGPWPLPWTILKEHRSTALTVHEIAVRWDAGDILLQVPLSLEIHESLETLTAKLQMLMRPTTGALLERFEHYWDNRRPQTSGSYWKFPTENDWTIEWSSPVAQIARQVRAFGKTETVAKVGPEIWNISVVEVWEQEHDLAPGTRVLVTERGLPVVAGLDGFVLVREGHPQPK